MCLVSSSGFVSGGHPWQTQTLLPLKILFVSLWKQRPSLHIIAGAPYMWAIKLFWAVFSPEQQLPTLKVLCQLCTRIWRSGCFQYHSHRLPQWGGKLVLVFFSPFLSSLSKHLCSAKWSELVAICDVHRCKPRVCVSAKVTVSVFSFLTPLLPLLLLLLGKGYLKMFYIPPGARHVIIQEHEASPQILGKCEFATQRNACPVSWEQMGLGMMRLEEKRCLLAGPSLNY